MDNRIVQYPGTQPVSPPVQIDADGVLDSRKLPDSEFLDLWDSIVLEDSIKNRLLSQAILTFTVRPKLSRAALPIHGVILLVGPPGTGKTSLARGLAARTAQCLPSVGKFRYIEVEPHALVGSALGRSQRAVRDFLGSTVAESAALGPLIVVLDEVETLAANRHKMSMEANPIDVHRASDAVLAQLDHLAGKYPNLLFLATSNFPDAIDEAFVSRADLVANIGLPVPDACRTILTKTAQDLAGAFPGIGRITEAPEFAEAASLCHGLDGRQIRKLLLTACTFDKETALDPNKLRAVDILNAVRYAKSNGEATGGTK